MPSDRRKKKGKAEHRRVDGSLQTSDDESYYNDNASVVSNVSENNRSNNGDSDAQQDGGGVDDNMAAEMLEDKLADVIDGLTQKSSQGRTNCFVTFTKGLVKKFMPGFIGDRNYTLCDCIEKSLKKGGGAEKKAAADLATVLCVQLGNEEGSDEIYNTLKPILLKTAGDTSAAPSIRSTCVAALGNIAFLAGADIGDIVALMQTFQEIFSGSFLKGDGSVPNITNEMGALHTAALNAWALLFTLMVPGNIGTMINNSKTLPSVDRLAELLESTYLDVRMSAGEALALVFELGREEQADFADEFTDNIMDTLKQLATDSQKFRAKKDRKQQRATFRDILHYLETGEMKEQVKFGKEVLVLDTWVRRKQYEALCTILGPGINVHLSENDFVRNMLEISSDVDYEPPVSAHAEHAMLRYRQHLINAANFKARTISRGKNRDKRADF